MELLLLGSSAGKPVPRPFCACRVCQVAIERGGRDVRTRTCLQIYPGRDTPSESRAVRRPEYQVDLPPDYVHQIIRERIDPFGLQHLFITHAHDDHFHPEYLKFRRTILSSIEDLPVLHVYGNESVERKLLAEVRDLEPIRCIFHRVTDGQEFEAGSLHVTTYRSTHARKIGCLHYAFDDGERCVLAAWDGTWEDDVWEQLYARTFHAIALECVHLGPTDGPSGGGHNAWRDVVAIKNRLLDHGMLHPGARIFLNHIGDNGGLTYEEACEWGAREGILIGYDGLVVRV